MSALALSTAEMLDCFRSDDLIGIGMEADAVRRRLHPEGVVTYANLRTLDVAAAGARLPAWLRESVTIGASGLELRNPPSLAALLATVATARREQPGLALATCTAAELLGLGAPVEDTLGRLQAAGAATLLADSAGVDTSAWIAVHRAAHRLGMPTTASLHFGAGEPFEARVATLEAIAALQAETGGFLAMTPETHHGGGRTLDETTAVESLKTLAICRLALPSIPHTQTGWASEGLKTLQLGLRFGANDIGSVLPPRLSAEGEAPATEEDLRRIVRDAGFEPAERDLLFRTLFLV